MRKSLVRDGAVGSLLLTAFLSGCATPARRSENPGELLSLACRPGEKTTGVKGSVWLKAKSQEASGQFPAVVEAKSPSFVRLEVTNVVGGTEAVITVEGQKYKIDSPKRSVKPEQGFGSWGGIPLRWADDLFLGQIPCPSKEESAGAKLAVSDQGELSVEIPASMAKGGAELYVYRFRSWEGRPWPESLHWERKGAFALAVDFKFDDPEDGTRSPRKWEAKSPRGEVKVRWRDREVASASGS